MKLSYFGNNSFAVLNYLNENEKEHKGVMITITNQQQIADDLHLAKLTVNAIMKDLIMNDFIYRIDKKGKYKITSRGKEVLRLMNTILKP